MNQVIQGTVRELERRYKDMSDEEIIREIRIGLCAGEALFYLLFGRYVEMLHLLYQNYGSAKMEFDDFMLELDIKLYAKQFAAISNFDIQKASFKTYLSKIAQNLLHDLRTKELPMLDISLVDCEICGEDSFEMFALMDAINTFPHLDSRYVLIKTIEGYKSKEIAAMLTSRKQEEGTLDKDRELKPSYIDTLRSRALKTIRNQIFIYNDESICSTAPSPSRTTSIFKSDSEMEESMCIIKSMDIIKGSTQFNLRTLHTGNQGLFILNIYQLYKQMIK